ncbi:unnamed protein product [Victoria cruziana]
MDRAMLMFSHWTSTPYRTKTFRTNFFSVVLLLSQLGIST